MKAILIDKQNKELLDAWGESEELTWENSFAFVRRCVLVVDDTLPQGYMTYTLSNFYGEYRWKDNFGTVGWSTIERMPKGADDSDYLTDSEVTARKAALSAAIEALPDYMVENRKVLSEMLSELSD
jgi:hypothetical protein